MYRGAIEFVFFFPACIAFVCMRQSEDDINNLCFNFRLPEVFCVGLVVHTFKSAKHSNLLCNVKRS